MKKDIFIVITFSILSIVFFLLADTLGVDFLSRQNIKKFVLCGLLVLVQTQIFNSIQRNLVVSNSGLIRSKRKLYLFYTETQDSFQKTYENVTKLHTYDSICFLLAFLNIDPMSENAFKLGKNWLSKKESIPYQNIEEKFSLFKKHRINKFINNYELTNTKYEDIFYDCLTGKIVDIERKQPIIEIILIWISYFFFLAEIFNINVNQYSTLIMIFIGITIADISKHYLAYKKEVEYNINTIDRFHSKLQNMHSIINEPDCLYKDFDGEKIPYARMSDFKDLNEVEF